jgi:cytochrome c biogenesis protein CcdA
MANGAGSYEFSDDQNRVLGKLAFGMRFVGIFMVVAGVAGTVGAFVDLKARGFNLPVSAMTILLGLNAAGGAKAFRGVVNTKGDDIPNLMNAVDYLRRFFLLLTAYIVVYLVVLVVGIVAATTPG